MPSHIVKSLFFKDVFGSAEMRAIFSDESLLQRWLDAEAALARAEGGLGVIPAEAAAGVALVLRPKDRRRRMKGVEVRKCGGVEVWRCGGERIFHVHSSTRAVWDRVA